MTYYFEYLVRHNFRFGRMCSTDFWHNLDTYLITESRGDFVYEQKEL